MIASAVESRAKSKTILLRTTHSETGTAKQTISETAATTPVLNLDLASAYMMIAPPTTSGTYRPAGRVSVAVAINSPLNAQDRTVGRSSEPGLPRTSTAIDASVM